MANTIPVMICNNKHNVKRLPQIHIQLRFLGVGIVKVEYKTPAIGSLESNHFSKFDFGS